jgi:hypothetical protein
MSVNSNRGHRCVMALAAIGCALALSACVASSKPTSSASTKPTGSASTKPTGSASTTHSPPGYFGWSLALYGSTAVVGAPFNNSGTGAAYVFVRSRGKWSQQAKLTASDATAGDQFGWSVALDGSAAVVGAPGNKAGAAYVFVRSRGEWSQQAKLTASDATAGDQLGFSAALDGSAAVVGAPGKNSKAGAAYVFVRSRGEWSQQAKLTASDATSGDFFSNAVAVSGSTAVVGAELANSTAGAAYVFVRSGTAWSQQAEFQGRQHGEQLGDAVAVSGSTAVVGAELRNSKTGAVYVFVRSRGKWSQQAKLTASDGTAGDQFGFSVAILGSTAVVSASTQNALTGAAYVFVRSSGEWSQQAKLTASDARSDDLFGAAVVISGSTAAMSAPFKNSKTGAAYVFVRSGTAWSQQAKLTAAHL